MSDYKAYINLCIENAGRLPEWRPKVGDWIWHPATEQFEECVALIVKIYPQFPNRELCADVSSDNMVWGPTELLGDWIPLPTLRQLIEMLEERGACLLLFKTGEWLESQGAGPWRCFWSKGWRDYIDGPDPETIMLKCLLEAGKKG